MSEQLTTLQTELQALQTEHQALQATHGAASAELLDLQRVRHDPRGSGEES